MNNEELRYKIGIGLIPKIGPVIAKRLISACGGVEGVFREKRENLSRISGIGRKLIDQIMEYRNSGVIDAEIEYIEKHRITALFYLDAGYPERLKHCEDAPLLLYVKGNASLEGDKVISVVGTRSPTDYGRQVTAELIETMALHYPEVIIVSGLAYGIDICAHRTALNNNLNTIAVLGHGLKTVYPSLHRDTAGKIVEKGALISEFMHDEKPESPNFVKRNRIIAGMSDATIVIESGKKGGALITADIAGSYNRDVFAVPGRSKDTRSQGCNHLIKSNRAAMVEGLADIEYQLGWQRPASQSEAIQKEIFISLDHDEDSIMSGLKEKDRLTVDQVALRCGMPVSKVSSVLLNLELKGLIRCLPGKVYAIP